ncbi:RNA polymerase sigma factor [Maribacter hydrothermalis]|uniref:RNA polymerase sigma factor n=1 Tax=Maribacter hydrothermalis TaxID=1836467 RepID=A0A1B7Z8K6_9FLAO|nr:RNA polymerase sigma factor [Maribacter hydrothermalis]APQ18919.1 RNA polymerase subunit sigma-24 [Maribacter hydrothermalis]OBR39068.1 RNA polymerase subunit sigma-24 [Maribacter hydrothermalis]
MKTEIRFTHQSLVENSKSGDRTAQYQLYELYVDAMYNVSMRFLGVKEDAEDIVQESFVDAFRNLDKFKYESSFGAWLKRIVINKSINHLKVKRLPLAAMDDNEYHLTNEDEHEYQNIDAMDIMKVKSGIEKLPYGYKQIINLYLLEGFDHNEISDVLGITTSTSKSQYHRAKKKLVEIINTL